MNEGRSDRFMLFPPDWEDWKKRNIQSHNMTDSRAQPASHQLTVKLSLLGVNSLGAWVFSLTCAGGEGRGGGLGVQTLTATSGDLWPSELRAVCSSLQTKGSPVERLAGSGSGRLNNTDRALRKNPTISWRFKDE